MSYVYKREVDRILYRLERNFAIPCTFYSETETRDYETGLNTKATTSYYIKKAIFMQDNVANKYSYDLTFLAANKNFQYGANYQTGTRFLILNKKRLSIDLSLYQYCMIDDIRYDLVDYEYFSPSNVVIIKILNSKNKS